LADLPNSRAAFAGKELRWKAGQYNRVIKQRRPDLTVSRWSSRQRTTVPSRT
jgi:hypothetical protein